MLRARLLAGLAAVVLTGCSTGSTTGSAATEPVAKAEAAAEAFPVTIEHAFGATTIEEPPIRVATLGWSDQDHAVALGVLPVGVTKITWGGNANGSTDWFDAAVEQFGGETPVQYDDSDGTPIAEVARVEPDLILATNSGLTEEEYDKLSKIAPVVAYPNAPWTTSWQDSLEMVGKALGLSEEAAEVKAGIEARIDEAKADYPQIQGKSMIFAYLTTADLSQIGIYGTSDPRVSFMKDLGFVDAPSVAQIVKDTEFYAPVSAERASELESDVVLTWLDDPKDMATFKKHKLIGQIPAIANGHVYGEADKEIGLAVTNPTPLSVPFVIEHFLPEAAAAVDGS